MRLIASSAIVDVACIPLGYHGVSAPERVPGIHFGPLIGRQPMAGITTHRLRHPLPYGLGSLDLAISYDTSGRDGQRVEAVPRHLDPPVKRTFENRQRFDALLIDTAIGALDVACSRRSL